MWQDLFLKSKNEYNRRIKLGKTKLFCSLKCGSLHNLENFNDKRCKVPIRLQPGFVQPTSNPFLYYMRNCRRRNKDKNTEVNIDENYLREIWKAQSGKCPYTKFDLVLNFHLMKKEEKDTRYLASLDRIDSKKGYIKGNVQFVSCAINYMKNNMTHDQTIEFIKLIKSS